jgi:hypothetical protein
MIALDTTVSSEVEAAAQLLILSEGAGIKPPAILGPTLKIYAGLARVMELELYQSRVLIEELTRRAPQTGALN